MPCLPKKSFLSLLMVGFLILPLSLGFAQTPQEERQALETELKALEAKIGQYEKEIQGTQKEKQTLQNKIKVLQAQIKKLDLEIRQGNLTISDLKRQVKETETAIDKTAQNLEQTRIKLKESLRTLYQENRKSTLELLLAEERLSDFFTSLANLEVLNSRVAQSLAGMKSLKSTLEEQKDSLDREKDSLQRMVSVQTLQRQTGQKQKEEQETILEKTKGREALYQKYLEESKKRAAEIRSRIFELIGIPRAPTFGEAYELAKYVKTVTGIRPAFLLAVLTQESNIGKNVGQCYLINEKTGEGKRATTGEKIAQVMAPGPPTAKRNDVAYFLEITRELGRDPFATPISCPIPSVGGYGGGMGPAQFIPDTWANPKSGAYGQKVKEITGKSADPWDIKDAFLAAGLFLRDAGGLKNEFRAAMRYFSGSSWTKYEEFYGRSVMALAENYQADIEALETP